MNNKLSILFFAASFAQLTVAMDEPLQKKLDNQLFVAIQEGNAELVKDLLAKGAHVQAGAGMSRKGLGPEYHTALTWAAKNGNEEICRLLLDANADIAGRCNALPFSAPIRMQITNNRGEPFLSTDINALDCAAAFGHEAICRQFIKAGADVNIQGSYGNTALMWAAEYGQAEVCTLLLQNGALLDLKNIEENTALVHAACFAGLDKEVCRILLEFGAGSSNMKEQVTAALLKGPPCLAAIELLVANGANVNARNRKAMTPLMIFADNAELCNFLIDHKADVNAKDIVGRAPIRWAIDRQDIENCRLLVSRKADVNTRDLVGNSPLMFAASSGLMPVCELLVNARANVHEKNYIGWNALMWAAQENSNQICTFLVDQHRKYDLSKKALWVVMKCLKNRGNVTARILLRNFETLLLPHFVYPSLSSVLTAPYSDGKIPYTYCSIDSMNPDLINRPNMIAKVAGESSHVSPEPEIESGESSWCSIQ